ncbi:MAG TPA: gamma-glutamyltransferase [Anaerolineae bacterium]|nr:gamma-glutamyltransferase [Anaerolineae bacterium]
MLGVIAAGNPHTAAAGAAMLKQGGNAVDAIVAAAFASFIAEIGVVHFGGSGVAQIFDSRTGQSLFYDFFSAMPGMGGDEWPKTLNFEPVTINFGATTQDFHLGRASVAVPGNLFGLCQLATEHGRLPLKMLLEPALEMAEHGVILDVFQAETCELLKPLYTHTETMRDIFLRDGEMIQPGQRLFIPDLADTLRLFGESGIEGIRRGRLAEAIVADQEKMGGLLTAADLEFYRVQLGSPIRINYRQYELLLPPPCSTGGVLTAFTLKLLSHFDVGSLTHGSARHLQLLYEVMAAALRARSLWDELAEGHTTGDALARFLAAEVIGEYVDEIRAAWQGGVRYEPVAEPPGPGNTSHISVIDHEGLAVGLTTTAGESAGYVVPGTGFILNNILGEGDLNPKGFHQWGAGQRISTMMAPTIVLQGGKVRLVVGSGGSERIRSAILQVLSNLLDFEMSLDDAVNTNRVHVQGGVLQCEWGYDEAAVAGFEQMGYEANRWPTRSIYFGGAHSVSRTATGRLVAAGDNRRAGSIAEA